MGIPQVIVIAIYIATLFIYADKDGKRKDGVYKFNSAFISTVIMIALLWWGGFFK